METVVVKIGGSTIDTPGLLDELAQSIAHISKTSHVVLVHGGGKDIGRQLNTLNKEFVFIEGMRVTDKETVGVVQMVLSGDVNKRIVNVCLTNGVNAIGLSGVDGSMLEAKKMMLGQQDIGFVGEIISVDIRPLTMCREAGFVPVVSPVSRDRVGQIYNVNADVAASDIAMALKADHLIYISDVPGVLVEKKVMPEIRLSGIEKLISDGHITGGMIPKIHSAAEAVTRGVGRVHITGWHGANTLADELKVESSSGTVVY